MLRRLAFGALPLFALSCGGSSKGDHSRSGGVTAGGAGTGAAAKGGAGGGTSGVGGTSVGGSSTGGAGAQAGSSNSSGVGGGSSGADGAGTGGHAGTAQSGAGGGAGEAFATGGGAGKMDATGGVTGEAGTMASGGSGGASGNASTVGGEGPGPGFSCFTDDTCDPGERCAVCHTQDVSYEGRCVPDPDLDGAGYEAAIADCIDILRYVDCDGPEDCNDGEYCAWTEHSTGTHCVGEAELPDPLFANCCYTCDSLPICTLCWNDSNCPEMQVCLPQPVAPRGVGGCRPPQ